MMFCWLLIWEVPMVQQYDKSVERLKSVGKHSLLGASGEISDFQEILWYLDEVMKFTPLWNSLVLGGVKNGQKYLGTVSMIGVHYEDNVATGFSNHLAKPIIRDEWCEDLIYEEGVKLLEKCMHVLLYRDRSAVNKLQIAKITEEGVTISQPYSLKTCGISLLSRIQVLVWWGHGN